MSLADALLDGFSDSDSEMPAENENHSIQELLTVSDFSNVNSISEYCSILPQLKSLEDKLGELETDSTNTDVDQSLLSETNKMITEIHTYFNTLNSFAKIVYNPVWPDLAQIIKNPLFYIKIITIIKFDVSSFKEQLSNGLFDFLSKDSILSLTMSSNFLLKSNRTQLPSEHVQTLAIEACEIMDYINNVQLKFKSFIAKKVEKIAPNLTALVGTTVSAQLMSTTGLETLVSTPACNIPSLGKTIDNNSLGYVYQCDIVKNITDDFKKQAIRQVCSKIVLAARMDMSRTKSAEMGLKWRNEIKQRLEKLMLPPENVRVKPLAKPVDMKSKKRGGRKFKKMRERMKMSEVEKAQNKMVFGEQELTKTDAFGEEVGMGMLGKTSIRGIDNVRRVHVTKGTQKTLENFNSGRVSKPNSESGDKKSKLADLLG